MKLRTGPAPPQHTRLRRLAQAARIPMALQRQVVSGNFEKQHFVTQFETRPASEFSSSDLARGAGRVKMHRGTSLIRKRTPSGPYRRPMPRVLGWPQGGRRFLMSEVPLYSDRVPMWNSHYATTKTCQQCPKCCLRPPQSTEQGPGGMASVVIHTK